MGAAASTPFLFIQLYSIWFDFVDQSFYIIKYNQKNIYPCHALKSVTDFIRHLKSHF